jgi:hypothetical protein
LDGRDVLLTAAASIGAWFVEGVLTPLVDFDDCRLIPRDCTSFDLSATRFWTTSRRRILSTFADFDRGFADDVDTVAGAGLRDNDCHERAVIPFPFTLTCSLTPTSETSHSARRILVAGRYLWIFVSFVVGVLRKLLLLK